MSVFEETFTGTDGDPPDTNYWQDPYESTNGSCELASNKLAVKITNPSTSQYTKVDSKFYVSGDFEFQVDMSGFVGTGNGGGGEMFFSIDADDFCYAKILYDSGSKWRGYSNIAGVFQNNDASRTNSYGRMKIARSSGTLTIHYDDGNTGSWTLLQSRAGFSTANGLVRLAIWTPANYTTETLFDNFIINSGTIDIVTGLEDMAMDIELWQSKLNDVPLDIYAVAWGNKDSKLDIAAYFQSMTDTLLSIDTLGEKIKNKKLDLFVALQELEPLPLNIHAATEQIKNALLDISLADGIITHDASMDIAIGDGNNITDMGMDIMTVGTMPGFKAVYAMHLDSVIKEI
ncbi:hypothetical protein [Desulfobacula phenolica]|uniref:Uncharacterized protein n=1 Tax=Desulfobacula phenolica TaxID=90732 RepID=A0A1H2I1Z8_9BACT|nr:hypothetical protein [Desulfobacula phenolica]SDU38160.1 hypothetical protein SAMN04487931_107187 [Desulfobacula phenolica]